MWPEAEAYHSPPSKTKVKNAWSYAYNPPYVFMASYLSTGIRLHLLMLKYKAS